MVSTESNLDNSCTDGDGLHVERTYTLFIDSNGDGLYEAAHDDWLADCTQSIDIICELDECGVCGGSGIPAGDCDCDGNVEDECGNCGGDGISGTSLVLASYTFMSHSLPHPSNATELAAITNPLNPSVAVLYSGESAAQNLFDWTSFNTVNSALGISLPGNNVSWNLFVQFTPSETGVYTFTVEGDDAVDISIDDTVIASHYGGHGVYSLGSHTGTVSMVAGQTVLLNGRGEEGGGGEGFRVFWKKPSDSSWQQDFTEMGQISSCDCDGNQLDECGICGGDGIADGDCDCDGNVNDECGICGGSGIPDGDCDCDGNSPTVINCPDDITVECLEDVMDCNVNDVTTVPLGASIICSQGSLVGDECNGTITNTYTVTDACGTHSCTQTITIMDTTAPELTIPEDYTAECSDEHPMDDASATDNCGEVTIDEVETIIPGSGDGCYTITRTFTATDDCGNATSATQTIAIVDTTPPVWDAFEPNVTVECTDGDENSILYLPITASDVCGDVTYSVMGICASGGCPYSMIRFWTATDDCGNATETEQYVSLYDVTAPELTVPADFFVDADAADCSADITPAAAGEASATDNCGVEDCWGSQMIFITYVDSDWTYTCDGDDDNTEGTRTLTRTWTATDRCDNAMSLDQLITVTDVTAPVGSAEDASVACAEYDSSVEYGSHAESDNCDTDVASSWINVEEFDVEGAGCYSVRREYTFTDDCGNSSTAEQIITVFDDVAPVISGLPFVELECSEYPDATYMLTLLMMWHGRTYFHGC